MKIACLRTSLAVLFVLSMLAPAMAAEAPPITVFAAASTTNALTEICQLFLERKMGKVLTSFASSSTLAKQIENGAPADIFISADTQWMDYLLGKRVIDPADRFDLLGNRIVLIAEKTGSIEKIDVAPGLSLSPLLGENRLAMGDPDHVPVGMYAREAFEKLGVWDGIRDKIACEKDVRAALVRVERGEAPLGVVYATDAAVSDRVKVVGIFPENTHSPIVYPVARVKGRDSEVVNRFLELLKGPDARRIFEKYGFLVR